MTVSRTNKGKIISLLPALIPIALAVAPVGGDFYWLVRVLMTLAVLCLTYITISKWDAPILIIDEDGFHSLGKKFFNPNLSLDFIPWENVVKITEAEEDVAKKSGGRTSAPVRFIAVDLSDNTQRRLLLKYATVSHEDMLAAMKRFKQMFEDRRKKVRDLLK